MFVTIKCENNKDMVINTNCAIPAIMDYLKVTNQINLQPGKEFLDLASETGDIVYDLPSKGKEYARRYLDTRSTLILIKGVYISSSDAQNPIMASAPNSSNDDTQNSQQQSQQTIQYTALAEVSEKVKQALQNPKRKKNIVDKEGGGGGAGGAGEHGQSAAEKRQQQQQQQQQMQQQVQQQFLQQKQLEQQQSKQQEQSQQQLHQNASGRPKTGSKAGQTRQKQ